MQTSARQRGQTLARCFTSEGRTLLRILNGIFPLYRALRGRKKSKLNAGSDRTRGGPARKGIAKLGARKMPSLVSRERNGKRLHLALVPTADGGSGLASSGVAKAAAMKWALARFSTRST